MNSGLHTSIDTGATNPSLSSDPTQKLALADARLLAASVILEIDPTVFNDWLDKLVWWSDLSESNLNAARNEAGIPIPPIFSLNSGIKAYPPRNMSDLD